MRKIAMLFFLSIAFAAPAIADPMDAKQAYTLKFTDSMNGKYGDYSAYTGNYLIMNSYFNDDNYLKKGEYDVYDIETEELINTLDLYQILNLDDPRLLVYLKKECYGELCCFCFSEWGLPYTLINITNGEIVWQLPEMPTIQFLAMDNERVLWVYYDNNKYDGLVISLYNYKEGIFEEGIVVLDEIVDLDSKQWYFHDYWGDFIAIREIKSPSTYGIIVINIRDNSIHEIEGSTLVDYFLTKEGHIITDYPVDEYGNIGNLICKINPVTGEKTIFDATKSGGTSGYHDWTYDPLTGHIYFFETKGTEVTVNRIIRRDEEIKTVNSEGEIQYSYKTHFETVQEPAYASKGQPIAYVSALSDNKYDAMDYHTNLFRMTDTGSDIVALSNDFFLRGIASSGIFVKNGNLIIAGVSSATAYIGDKNIASLEGTYKTNQSCLSNIDQYYCTECDCTTFSDIKIIYPETDFYCAAVINASSPSTYEYSSLIIVEPAVPAKADESSKTKEGAEYIRTYKLKAPDGSALQGAVVTSLSGLTSTSNGKGFVGVRNIAIDEAGTYSGKTVYDVIASISYNGKTYSFYLNTKYGEQDNFELVIEPGGVFEKRYDLELGGSLSGGIGAFKFGTIKAASIDLEASAASGIYFNIIDDEGTKSMEMGRHLNAGLGANAVLAEADLKGGFSASAGVGLDLMAVGAQSFLVDDPFEDANTTSRSVTTTFIWDTLVKNGTLAFPSVGLIINWIWDNIKSDDLNERMSLKSAGLQVGGEASAGIDIPALEIASGGTELAGSNLSNLGLSLPSISGGFVIEGLLHEFIISDNSEKIGLEVSITTEMEIDAGIFGGVYNFTGLPELPEGHKSTFGLMASFDSSDNPHTLYLNYMTEQESGEQIKVSETEFELDATQVLENISLLPSTLQNISQRKDVGSLSWDTKGLQSLYKEAIHAAGKGVSGSFTTFTDMVDDTTYEFEIGLGLGLNFGIGAHFSYLEHERSKQKSYKIDDVSEGMALVEDWSNLTPRFPSQTFGDIMTITLEYLKDRVKEIYTIVVETVESGVDTVVTSGKAVLKFVGITKSRSTTAPYQIALSTFVPLSSDQDSSSKSMSKSIPKTTLAALRQFAALDTTSASVGEAALINVMDQDNNLIDEFSAATLTLTYTDDDLTKAGLTKANESDLFMWQFRSSDRKHAKLSGYTLDTTANTASYTNVTTNSVFGIGFDNVSPEATYKYPENGSTINSDKGIFWKLSDDFSGIDFDSITIQLDGSTIVDSSNIEEYFNPSNGFLLVDTTFETGDHVLSISMRDTAGNSFADSIAFSVETQNSSDFDNDGVSNYQDKFPLDANFWQDDDNDGVPDSQDTDITSSGDLTCSCGSLKASPTEAIDFKNCFGTFENLVMTLHNIAVDVDGEYQYFWIETAYDAENAGFVFNGNFGQETDIDDIDCNCGLRTNTNHDALSLENTYTEFNYNNRLTLHDLAIQNDAGEYNYYWLNFSIDLSTLNFIAMDEFNLEIN